MARARRTGGSEMKITARQRHALQECGPRPSYSRDEGEKRRGCRSASLPQSRAARASSFQGKEPRIKDITAVNFVMRRRSVGGSEMKITARQRHALQECGPRPSYSCDEGEKRRGCRSASLPHPPRGRELLPGEGAWGLVASAFINSPPRSGIGFFGYFFCKKSNDCASQPARAACGGRCGAR